jgi:ectoine hydroxylase
MQNATRTDIYPSRTADRPQVLERKDPVVYSDGKPARGLTADQVKSYERNGFLAFDHLFSLEEIEDFTAELDRMKTSKEILESGEVITEPGSGEVRSIFRVHAWSSLFDRLARSRRILDIVQFLLDDEVYIHQSRINFKPGFAGKDFYWHSDFETWHVEDGMPRMRAVSLSIALTENNEFNGPLMLVPGSHRKFVACVGATPENHYKESLKKQETGVPDHESLIELVQEGGLVAPKGNPGSATFFECNTMHGSNSNITPFPRSNVFFVFNAMSNRLVDPYCGLPPRPGFIATRTVSSGLKPSDETASLN